MNQQTTNIFHHYPDGTIPPGTIFHSIWTVKADPSYDVHHPHGFDLPGIFVTYEGEGLVHRYTEDPPRVLPSGSIYFINPGEPCDYRCPENGYWAFYFIRYNAPELLSGCHLMPHTCYTGIDPAFLKQRGERIITEMITKGPGHTLAADTALRQMLLILARQEAHTGGSTITPVITWMYQNLGRPARISELTTMSCMGRTALFKTFKQETGQSPIAYFIRLKLESARLLLETTDKKVHRIATELGFYDEFHFSRQFKRAYGSAPGAYRRSSRQ